MNGSQRPNHPGLELWGGVECTVNRVGDDYIQQIERSGHHRRLSDFESFAKLGIKALRHPVLWERVAPLGLHQPDWSWADKSLARIRDLKIRPIVGLLHHGSGPRSTNLLHPEFPELLSEYAAAVATRYDWIEDYTPVNEPLTTARFSCLYGHWYPHEQTNLAFVRSLLNQCRAVVLAMRAVRKVNPSARLIQTDDLGKVFSTPKLTYQAEFENERRWLTYDLLCGRVNREHSMWSFLMWVGVSPADLEWFLDNPCPPDVVGVNHYLSSERYLDEHVDRYPGVSVGGNGRDRYADVLAARVLSDGAAGPAALMLEAWDRYKLPVAVTECHNGCTREEQMRWFLEVWRGANEARSKGANVIAVTAWSLLGAFDWDTLVTRNLGHYEPGIYDLRSSDPRPTALASVISELSASREPDHPLLQVPGWWRRPTRLIYGFSLDGQGEMQDLPSEARDLSGANVRPVLITGARGTLGRAFARLCEVRGIPYRLLTRAELDIASPNSVRKALFQIHPWALINAAGYVRVDDAETERDRCYRENTQGPAVLAQECAARGIQLLTFSSDLVFGGSVLRPYVEGDDVGPLNYYGVTKADAEKRVLARLPSALVVRSSAFFSPWDEYNFVHIALKALRAKRTFRAADDVIVSPTYLPDLVNACLDLLIDGECGVWHLANAGETSWAALAESAAELAGISARTLDSCAFRQLNLPACRPRYSALGSGRGILLPSLDEALRRFVAEWNVPTLTSEEIAA